MFLIRKYQASDCAELAELFYTTVHTANAKDYSKEQLDAWAPLTRNLKEWNRSFEKHISFVAVENKQIVGQRMGIGTAICNKLEGAVQGNVFTHASITAKPFFEKRGYKVIKGQTVKRRGVLLTNFVMEYRR
ncbi:GNAT family N-acetyltransferase [uncultured Parasutterella sp.]|jgi:putative acetyltransferase|uniref:GNAT family N-acetyltransferase n=1 Tax=uncultured Parasutterella sp. TaxID=1263098 RepID=UPI0025E1B342|nr:GNAT family N-acetyltransferase [uncultured Parasutterella sp.]